MINKIYFDKIQIQNFMSYSHSEITFNEGLNLITGKNGHGKTTQFIALYYALFGKPYKKVKNASLINTKINKEMFVKLNFRVGTDEYIITRGQKPNIFEIEKNNIKLNQNASTTEQQYILENEILKLNEHTFKQLIFLGANVNTTKSFVDLTKSEKEQLFELITDTAIFNELKDSVKEKIKTLNTQKEQISYQSNVLSTLIKTEEDNIEKIKQQNEIFKSQNTENINVLKENIKTVEGEIAKYTEGLEKIRNKKPEYEEVNDQFKTSSTNLSNLNNEIKNLESILNSIDNVKKSFSVCIGCEKLKNISNIDISNEEVTKKSLQEKNDQYILEYNNNEILKSQVDTLLDLFSKGRNLKVLLETKQKDLQRYNNELETLNNRKLIDIDTTSLENNKLEYSKLIASLEDINTTVLKYQTLLKLFDTNNIKGIIIKQSLPLLNKFINEYLDSFSDFPFKFSIDEQFNTGIKRNNALDYEFGALSNGQAMRITFSIVLAFLRLVEHKNGVSTNLLILDEILDSSLDSDGRMELLELIKRNFYNKSVFVISHNSEIVDNEYFDHYYKVTQTNDISQILKI